MLERLHVTEDVEEAKVQSVLCGIDCVGRGGSGVDLVFNAYRFVFQVLKEGVEIWIVEINRGLMSRFRILGRSFVGRVRGSFGMILGGR